MSDNTQTRKRGRPETQRTEFAIHENYREAKDYLAKCRSGEVEYETRLWDQDSYVANHRNPRDASKKLLENPVALEEIMYNGKPLGKKTYFFL